MSEGAKQWRCQLGSSGHQISRCDADLFGRGNEDAAHQLDLIWAASCAQGKIGNSVISFPPLWLKPVLVSRRKHTCSQCRGHGHVCGFAGRSRRPRHDQLSARPGSYGKTCAGAGK